MTHITIERAKLDRWLATVDEATTYTSGFSSSPSMTRECKDLCNEIKQALAAPTVQEPDAAALFREALGFGWIYGPEIPAHQWDEMREEKVAQLVARLTTPPAAPVKKNVWEMFAAYLVDKCEGEIITEEGLQRSLADMLSDPAYATPPAAPVQKNEWVGTIIDSGNGYKAIGFSVDKLTDIPVGTRCYTNQPAAQPATEESSETQTASAYVKTYHGGKPWLLQPAPEKGQP
jgi:hypothetical protein